MQNTVYATIQMSHQIIFDEPWNDPEVRGCPPQGLCQCCPMDTPMALEFYKFERSQEIQSEERWESYVIQTPTCPPPSPYDRYTFMALFFEQYGRRPIPAWQSECNKTFMPSAQPPAEIYGTQTITSSVQQEAERYGENPSTPPIQISCETYDNGEFISPVQDLFKSNDKYDDMSFMANPMFASEANNRRAGPVIQSSPEIRNNQAFMPSMDYSAKPYENETFMTSIQHMTEPYKSRESVISPMQSPQADKQYSRYQLSAPPRGKGSKMKGKQNSKSQAKRHKDSHSPKTLAAPRSLEFPKSSKRGGRVSAFAIAEQRNLKRALALSKAQVTRANSGISQDSFSATSDIEYEASEEEYKAFNKDYRSETPEYESKSHNDEHRLLKEQAQNGSSVSEYHSEPNSSQVQSRFRFSGKSLPGQSLPEESQFEKLSSGKSTTATSSSARTSGFSKKSKPRQSTSSRAWSDEEYADLYLCIYEFREDEKRRNVAKKDWAKDTRFWSAISTEMATEGHARSAVACKMNWSRVGRERYQYEERADPPPNGSLVSSRQ
jgi:hypothetical protein